VLTGTKVRQVIELAKYFFKKILRIPQILRFRPHKIKRPADLSIVKRLRGHWMAQRYDKLLSWQNIFSKKFCASYKSCGSGNGIRVSQLVYRIAGFNFCKRIFGFLYCPLP
jgi:hypothetical protein